MLSLLAEQPMHGYEIMQQIGVRSGGGWRPSPGSVYPALQLLEDQGLIQDEPTGGRRVFHLTAEGQTYVEQHRAELAAAWTAVAATGADAGPVMRDLLDQVGTAIQQLVHVGAENQLAAARELLTNTRRQIYRILADDEQPRATTEPPTEQV